MHKNFDYFDTTKKSAWNFRDAFDAFKKADPNLTIAQQLTKFHEQLRKEDDNLLKSWLTNWKTFCRQSEPAKAIPARTSNPNINIDIKRSTNHGFSFGNVHNYYDNNQKKRELEDREFENPPAKKCNSAIPTDPETSLIDENNCLSVSSPAESQQSSLTEVITHATESDSLSESPASDCATEQFVDLATDQPAINSQDDIWACWKLHLDDDSLHKYSLERLGIIQCGNKMQCRDFYSVELYNLFIYNPSASINPVSNNAGIFDPIFDETSDMSLMSRMLYQIAYEDKQDPQVFMVTSVLEIFLKSIFASVCVTDQESNYSHYIIWPLLDVVVATVDELKFHCGEYRLGSVDKELSRKNIRSNQYYKSDGCISTLIDDARIELVLLEVSGPFKLNDESRFIRDHVKAGYGLIAMLNEIAHTYKFASFDIFTTVRIFFLHAKKNKLRFWSFEMPAPGLYVLNLLNSVVIPDNCTSCELPVESLCIELWNLRTMIQQTITAIANLRQSHIVNQRIYNRSHRQFPDLMPTLLTDSLRINPKVKLDVGYIPADDELAIDSSLF
ncbi:hypothetical protein BD408DRAFT_442431 [Parasitella parasitica]|nr:hypothetical protein BD408DRAFT_442431 [Parasitella parasitica]